MSDFAFFNCHDIGLSGTTDVVVKKNIDGRFEARMGVSVFGQTLQPDSERPSNPFDKKFHDNYVRGTGGTREEAIQNLRQDKKDMSDGLWA